ncbi:GNAT family N-acetyltransferase [Burkholderia singularis]|uniref:GNAT family N-acetyltransferase n=1 Tax=Burkholderia singularis TaxID=1503053 RepID=UPI00351242E6
MSAATVHASECWNVVQLLLCVNAENVAAKKLYVSQGFRTFGTEPRAMQINGRFFDEEHMCKQLA